MNRALVEGADRASSIYLDLYSEMAISLHFFIERLHHSLAETKTEQVFFLSREGQPLMRMFELFQARKGQVATVHYLEASRRSTLLPSLAPLEQESFHTLFRQYRRMSLYEFMSSLALEDYCPQFGEELGLSNEKIHERLDDIPTSEIFAKLKGLPGFRTVYEKERTGRRNAFLEYLFTLSGGKLPCRFVVVDVGWKGTIQDNLFAILCRNGISSVNAVVGYYIGLVADGASGPGNEKHGLLFSRIGLRTPHFPIFNENRALFEILLAADHGSVARYTTDRDGARIVRDKFEEGEMLADKVFPVQRYLMRSFEKMVHSDRAPFTLREVALHHARMVFRPNSKEVDWFSSVFHVENYGVFERSYFNSGTVRPSFRSRLSFVVDVFQKRRPGELGFWPWLTLRNQGFWIVSYIYAAIRCLQR